MNRGRTALGYTMRAQVTCQFTFTDPLSHVQQLQVLSGSVYGQG